MLKILKSHNKYKSEIKKLLIDRFTTFHVSIIRDIDKIFESKSCDFLVLMPFMMEKITGKKIAKEEISILNVCIWVLYEHIDDVVDNDKKFSANYLNLLPYIYKKTNDERYFNTTNKYIGKSENSIVNSDDLYMKSIAIYSPLFNAIKNYDFEYKIFTFFKNILNARQMCDDVLDLDEDISRENITPTVSIYRKSLCESIDYKKPCADIVIDFCIKAKKSLISLKNKEKNKKESEEAYKFIINNFIKPFYDASLPWSSQTSRSL